MSSQSDANPPPSGGSFTTRQKGTQLIRTCQNCVAAKVRCTRQSKSNICDRCQRLNKDCFYREARRRQHGGESDARIEALEAKIDQLLSQPSQTPSPHQTKDVEASPSLTPNVGPTYSGAHRDMAIPDLYAQFGQTMSESSPYSSIPSNFLEGFFTSDEANRLLNSFRTSMNSHFPFVIVPLHMTAEELAFERPFLLLAALTAASHENMPLQKHLCDEVKSTVSDRIITEGDVSLDMLQGLLVYLAWCQYHPRPRQYVLLVNLAMALVSEWALDVPSEDDSWRARANWPSDEQFAEDNTSEGMTGSSTAYGIPICTTSTRIRKGTTEEYRAMLGCYYLAANAAVLLGKRNAFTYSLFVEDVARSFTENPEHPTDKYLLYHVQFQHLLEKIDRVAMNRNKNLDAIHVIGAWAATLRAELDMLKESLPFPVEESFSLSMQIRSTELYLYQVSLPDKHYPTSRGPASWDPMRAELLSAGLVATTQTFKAYLALPFNAEKAFSNNEWIQLVTALLVGAKLAVAAAAQAVARQTQSLRRMLAFGAVLKQFRVRLGAIISPLVDGRGDRDVFYHFERRVEHVEEWYWANFAKATELGSTASDPTLNLNTDGVDPMWSTGLGPSPPQIQLTIPSMPSITVNDAYQAAGLDSDPLAMDPNFSFYFPDSVVAEIMGGWTSDAPPSRGKP